MLTGLKVDHSCVCLVNLQVDLIMEGRGSPWEIHGVSDCELNNSLLTLFYFIRKSKIKATFDLFMPRDYFF